MGRKNLYDVLNELEFDVEKEYDRLWYLLNEKKMSFHQTSIPFIGYIDIFVFDHLPVRGTANNLSDLFNDLELNNICYDIDDLFLLSELLLVLDPSIYPVADAYEKQQKIAIRIYNQIKSNIQEICSRTNHEIFDNGGKPIIVEKNKLTSHAVELVGDTSLALSMIEYNHYALKGHLEEKKKVLLQLGNYIEPILKEHLLKNEGFGNLESDAGFILNNFHIRHNNKEGKKAQEFILSLTDDQLEDWYDKAYNTLLSVIIGKEQISISKELKQLKQEYNWIS